MDAMNDNIVATGDEAGVVRIVYVKNLIFLTLFFSGVFRFLIFEQYI